MSDHVIEKTSIKAETEVPPAHQVSRRNFAKKAFTTAGILTALPLLAVPKAAEAWMNGTFHEREDLADAFKVLVKTYSDTKPYPHKFNDALVKAQLSDLDFIVGKGLEKEFARYQNAHDEIESLIETTDERAAFHRLMATGNDCRLI